MRKISKRKQITKKPKKTVRSFSVIQPPFLFFFLAAVAVIGIGAFVQQRVVLSQHTESFQSDTDRQTRRIVVEPSDLDMTSSSPAVVATDGKNKWFLYNDTNDTIDNTLGSFVTGPATPFYGKGSVSFTLGASPLDRKNVATYQFSGKRLSSITQMSFGVYSHSGVAGASEDPFLNFNVDFTGSSSAFQKRLVYVPSSNGTVTQDTWQKWDAIAGGAAKWTWSGYAAFGSKWPDGNTNQYRTWTDILTAFPNARLLPVGGWLGIRVGEPGPTGYTANVDFFSLTEKHETTVFDFEPEEVTPSVSPSPCDRDGWRHFRSPSFANERECHEHEDNDHGRKADAVISQGQSAR